MRNDAAATAGRVDMRIWFGFRRLPFSQEVKADEMFLRPCMEEVCDRVAFAAQQGLMFAVIGDVGAGKSTALRYTFSRLPKKQYSVLQMTGGSWSFTELLRSCSNSMNVYTRTSQQTMMLKQIADGYASIRESGATPLLFIDEAHLFQQDVFRQLHLLAQPFPTSRVVPVVMCGQESLIDKLSDPFCKPLMSRIIDGYNIHAMGIEEYRNYMKHQVEVIGGAQDVFDDAALTVIHQSTAGLPRRVNETALLALKEAMDRGAHTVTADMVRLVSKKWWEK